ncbi:MAG: flagellar FliJ family protein [Pseudomonadota bacterium]|nr:flagellar FliJ family protein [Pseudomonadota bacterium]
MNDDLHALRILLGQAERQRDEALAEQLRLAATLLAAEAQAEQLVVYRQAYEARWSEAFSREGHIELVRCYQGFVERLNQAVAQQQGVAVQAATQVERAIAIVLGHDVRAAALKKLIERRTEQGLRADGMLERKQHDEHASRAAWLRLAAANPRRNA